MGRPFLPYALVFSALFAARGAAAQSANLAISASVPSTVTAGDALVTTIVVTNNGPGDAIGVDISVQSFATPQQMTGPPGWDCSASNCHLDTTLPRGSATFVLTSLVPAKWIDPSLAEKLVVSSSNDPDDQDNTIYVTTAVNPAPKTTLKVAITVTPEHFYAGDTVSYTATLTNTGSSAAYDITFGMLINKGDVLASSCGASAIVVCKYSSLAAGETQTITANARMWSSLSPGSQVSQSAYVLAFNAPIDNVFLTTTLNLSPPPNRRRAARH